MDAFYAQFYRSRRRTCAIDHQQFGKSALIIALLSGVIATCMINIKHFDNIGRAFSEGAMGALMAIANTAAVVGFGGVAKATPAFDQAVQWMTHLPGEPLIGSAIAICVIAGLTGSASGGQAIALPLLAPHYLDMGVNPALVIQAARTGELSALCRSKR